MQEHFVDLFESYLWLRRHRSGALDNVREGIGFEMIDDLLAHIGHEITKNTFFTIARGVTQHAVARLDDAIDGLVYFEHVDIARLLGQGKTSLGTANGPHQAGPCEPLKHLAQVGFRNADRTRYLTGRNRLFTVMVGQVCERMNAEIGRIGDVQNQC